MILETGLLLLALIGLVAYVVRGVTGAASAIIFNALFGVALALGLAGDLTLLDGLYWIALGDLLAAVIMLVALRGELTIEPFIRRLLIIMVPVAVAFTLVLPRIDIRVLALGMGVVLVGSGLYLGLRRTLGVWDEDTLGRRAMPTGLAAGGLSGLYGMAGPILVVYLAHAGSETRRFRARSTIISATLAVARAVTLVASGAIGTESLVRFGVTAPVVVLGLGIGLWLHPKVGPRAFRFGLGLIVIVAGSVLVARTIIGSP